MNEFHPSRVSGWPALSIRQPHAALILDRLKKYESRKWEPAYRGPIWLHASSRIDSSVGLIADRELTVGAVLGVVRLLEVVGVKPKDGAEFDRLTGPLHWKLEVVHRLAEPVRCPGKLLLFRLPPAVMRRCRSQLPR